ATPVLLEKATKEAINLLAFIYGQIYFPIYSNGLKEIAAFMGFSWPNPEGTGPHSVMWRHQWEESRSTEIQQKLIAYNRADCEALELLTKALCKLPSREDAKKSKENSAIAFVADNMDNAFVNIR
ncbi:MAG: ribonuclease H-like domain-containing protein, partial [Candidatus Omnitrophica bacterium]|nr:ribonuclease H-like domain-containing protein [Candidatus Omnitrophota bacterium]